VIALDCDALDPGIMPAVAAPTPGGLTYTQLIELIGGIAAKARIAGFNLVEFVPGRDTGNLSGLTAARILCNVVGAIGKAGKR
jgi:agmatinase